MKLKNLYKDEEFLSYCENGNFAGVYTNLLNGVDLNQRKYNYCGKTGLIYAIESGN